eukprot:PhF_6_TR20406/c0_g2_i2/m.29376
MESGTEIVQTKSVIQYLEFTCRKSVVHQGFVLYLVFIVLFVISVLGPQSDSVLAINAEYCKTVLLRSDMAESMDTLADFWDWANAMIEPIWSTRIEKDPNTPIGGLVLRQYRRKLKPCFKIPLQD